MISSTYMYIYVKVWKCIFYCTVQSVILCTVTRLCKSRSLSILNVQFRETFSLYRVPASELTVRPFEIGRSRIAYGVHSVHVVHACCMYCIENCKCVVCNCNYSKFACMHICTYLHICMYVNWNHSCIPGEIALREYPILARSTWHKW